MFIAAVQCMSYMIIVFAFKMLLYLYFYHKQASVFVIRRLTNLLTYLLTYSFTYLPECRYHVVKNFHDTRIRFGTIYKIIAADEQNIIHRARTASRGKNTTQNASTVHRKSTVPPSLLSSSSSSSSPFIIS